MFNKKKTSLEKEIENVLKQMEKEDSYTEEYCTMVSNLETLHKMKALEPKKKLSPDTILTVAANVIGIILILKFEETGIITSKALGFLSKGRV